MRGSFAAKLRPGNNTMYVVVIGLGEVGRHLVRMLEWEKTDIAVIDNSPESIAAIEEHHDVMTLLGYGASHQRLTQAGVDKADLVVAVTNNDEVNLIAALAAKQLGAKQVVARVQEEEWAQHQEGVTYGLLGVDVVINPQVLVATEIARIARSHGALEVLELANDRIELVQMELSEKSKMLRKPLSKLNLPNNTLIAGIVREKEFLVPGGADYLLPNDRIYILGRTGHMEAAEDPYGPMRPKGLMGPWDPGPGFATGTRDP